MANYTGTNWVTRTCIATDILSTIDEGLGQAVEDIKTLNADLTDINPVFNTLDAMIEYVNNLKTLQTVSFGCHGAVNQILTGNNAYGKGLVQRMNADNYFDYLIYSTSYIYSGRYNNGDITLRRFEGTSISLSSVGDPVVMGEENDID